MKFIKAVAMLLANIKIITSKSIWGTDIIYINQMYDYKKSKFVIDNSDLSINTEFKFLAKLSKNNYLVLDSLKKLRLLTVS